MTRSELHLQSSSIQIVPKIGEVVRNGLLTIVLSATGFDRIIAPTFPPWLCISIFSGDGIGASSDRPIVGGVRSEADPPCLECLVPDLKRGVLIISRFFVGFGAIAVYALADGILADVWRPKQRGCSLGVQLLISITGRSCRCDLNRCLWTFYLGSASADN
ncbi:hypothetical protein N7523_003770 [Penicillium sp. IBT 18751x]|nr:hypothetical protein N7523_003770 [Penicillium sp. IBT 18751x]